MGEELGTRAGRVEGGDELVQLARSFDEMADRVQATVHAQREFVANASHQLRTPLTGMKLRIGSAIVSTNDAALRSELEATDREIDRLAGIVERLLVMARQIEEGQQTHVDLADAAARAVERWRERASQAGASIGAEGPRLIALANPDDIDQALDVLIDNAISHAQGRSSFAPVTTARAWP